MTLSRALFGDFDVEEILANTNQYTSAICFLSYIFVAIFILLSMFLAILAEAQSEVREKQEREEAEREEDDEKVGAVEAFFSALARRLDYLESKCAAIVGQGCHITVGRRLDHPGSKCALIPCEQGWCNGQRGGCGAGCGAGWQTYVAVPAAGGVRGIAGGVEISRA